MGWKQLVPRPVKDVIRTLRIARDASELARHNAQVAERATQLSERLLGVAQSTENIAKTAQGLGTFAPIHGCTYNKDGLITFHNTDFLRDPLFYESYRRAKKTGAWHGADIEFRCYVACWAGYHAKNLEGDFVECGVERGGLSRAVMHFIGFKEMKDRKFYLLDTFQGFPERFRQVAVQANLSVYDECFADVVQNFSEFDNAVIVRGTVPDTLSQVPSEKVCYLSIDMNCAEPEIAAAEYFWDKLVPGAVVLLDDYAFSDDYLRQKHAFDRFAEERGVKILTLPTGQGLLLKP